MRLLTNATTRQCRNSSKSGLLYMYRCMCVYKCMYVCRTNHYPKYKLDLHVLCLQQSCCYLLLIIAQFKECLDSQTILLYIYAIILFGKITKKLCKIQGAESQRIPQYCIAWATLLVFR